MLKVLVKEDNGELTTGTCESACVGVIAGVDCYDENGNPFTIIGTVQEILCESN